LCPTSDSCSHLMCGLMPKLLRSEIPARPSGSHGLPAHARRTPDA
jgi:hypothetical protein